MPTPRKGQRFKARRDIQLRSRVIFAAPFSSSSRGTLPRGEIVIIDRDPAQGATAFSALPEHYSELEHVFVPPRDRAHARYSDYVLVLYPRTLAREFVALPDPDTPAH